jgi:hypothetical protein
LDKRRTCNGYLTPSEMVEDEMRWLVHLNSHQHFWIRNSQGADLGTKTLTLGRRKQLATVRIILCSAEQTFRTSGRVENWNPKLLNWSVLCDDVGSCWQSTLEIVFDV